MAPILIYHTVDNYEQARPAGVDCPPSVFAEHMTWLSQNYKVIPLQELTEEYLAKGKTAPRDVAVVTFDDGYEDNYTNAFPILRNLALPATIFCVTKYLDATWPAADWGGLEKPMLKAEQMKEMAQCGISFGAHGHSHIELTKLSPDEVKEELSLSWQTLKELTGRKPQYVSYPFGSFDKKVTQLSKEVGYGAAFTVWTKKPTLFSLNRLPIHRKDQGLRFQLKINHYEWVKPILATFR